MAGFLLDTNHLSEALQHSAWTRHLHLDSAPPSANSCLQMVKMCIFLEEFGPLRQFPWRAEGGDALRKSLTPAFFWPSANSLAWREGGGIAYVACVCKTRRRNAIHFRTLPTDGRGLRRCG